MREAVGVGHFERGHVFDGLHQKNRTFGKLPHRAFHFGVPRVADHDDLVALRIQPRHFLVHFGNQRAGGVEHAETPRRRLVLHRFGHAVRRVDQGRARRHVGQILNENRAFLAQVVHHEFVVDDFVAHVNRRAEFFQRALHDADGSVHARAEAARIGEHDGFAAHEASFCVFSDGLPCFLWVKLSSTSSAAPTQMKLSATLNAG